MAVETITLRLVGVGPMLMHSSRLADPLDPQAKALGKVTSKRHKTDADHHRIAELEWVGSLWLHEGRPCLPPAAIKGALVNGAMTVRKGKATRAAFVAEGPAMLEYDGPKAVEELRDDPRFRHREMVRVGDALVARTRPCFDGWSAIVRGSFITTIINREDLVSYFRLAGPYGIGDRRPDFGRFLIEESQLE
jgi:hypothetical protein